MLLAQHGIFDGLGKFKVQPSFLVRSQFAILVGCEVSSEGLCRHH